MISKLKSSDDHSSQQSSSSSSGNGSIKSGSGSPRQQNLGQKTEPVNRKDSEVSQQRSAGEADTTNIRLKLGGFSGRSSRYYTFLDNISESGGKIRKKVQFRINAALVIKD